MFYRRLPGNTEAKITQKSAHRRTTLSGYILATKTCIDNRKKLVKQQYLAIFTLRPSLAFSYIGSVTARHSSSGVNQILRRGTTNGITELSQKAPPIFGWAAIIWGIGPYSSSFFFSSLIVCGRKVDVYCTSTHYSKPSGH